DGLNHAGAKAKLFESPVRLTPGPWDAVVIALLPREQPLGMAHLEMLASKAPDAVIAQFWGDVDRHAARSLGLHLCPAAEPGPGHMGILLNRLGHEPIVRLQAGSLKAAELVRRGSPLHAQGIASLL